MPQRQSAPPSDWALAVRQRRASLLQRVAVAVTASLVFTPILGWDFGLAWFSLYLLIQGLDLWVFAPINRGAERMSPLRTIFGGAILFANAGAFSALSVPLWLVGGPMGGVCATILVSAGSVYSIINAPRSTAVMALTTSAHFLYLAAMPVFMALYGASPPVVVASAIAVAVYVAYCLSSWSRMNQARDAEAKARLEAERKRTEAEAAMAGRGAFMAAVGHDLRTPISAILTGAAELERGASDSQARANARLISDAGLMMKALLDDLLDHAKLESGRMTTESADFDLRALVARTLRLWQGPARAKGLKLRVEGAASLPRVVRGDAMRLNQILNNLMSNALKFTDQGAITLRLSAWPDDQGRHAVVMEVADTGPGMDAEQMSRLFTAFDQTADGVSARHGGTGLGLSISRDLARLMGGRLTARSAPGRGACFTLALGFADGERADLVPATLDPAARDAAARALTAAGVAPVAIAPEAPAAEAPVANVAPEPSPEPSPEPEPPTEDDRPLRVLVVDDHDINRRAIQLILTPLGCDVATAVDGLAALDACADAAFDVIFMDVRMPELDGRETTRRLRAGGGPNVETPIIAVTADTSSEDIAACTEAGMDYFVPKPITPASLLSALETVLAASADDDASEPGAAGQAA